MNIQVGQWYRCRDNTHLAHIASPIFHNDFKFAIVAYANGLFVSVYFVTKEGRYVRSGEESAIDLIEHLPDCTGPDWEPKKWRPATIDDLKNGFCSARFRDSDQRKWIESCVCGVRWRGAKLYWQDSEGSHWWKQCEVLDEQP